MKSILLVILVAVLSMNCKRKEAPTDNTDKVVFSDSLKKKAHVVLNWIYLH